MHFERSPSQAPSRLPGVDVSSRELAADDGARAYRSGAADCGGVLLKRSLGCALQLARTGIRPKRTSCTTLLLSVRQVEAVRQARLEAQQWKFQLEQSRNELLHKNAEVQALQRRSESALARQQAEGAAGAKAQVRARNTKMLDALACTSDRGPRMDWWIAQVPASARQVIR